MRIKIRVISALVFLCGWLGQSATANKELHLIAGGVTFRTDDNGINPEYFKLRAGVFEKHGVKFAVAVNLLAAESQEGMIAVLKEIQDRGYDLMDHTPNHSNIAITFARDDDISWCQKQPGLDHFDAKVAYLRYAFSVPPEDRESRQVNVSSNRLTPVVAEGADRWFRDSEYVYFPAAKVFCRILSREVVKGVYPLKSVWNEDNVDLKNLVDTPVQIVASHEVQPTPEAMSILAQTIRRVCDRQGMKYPVTYAAPGNSPHLTRSSVKAVYGDKFGYQSAGVYPASMARVFNEPDPDGNAVFGMQWGDIDEGQDFAAMKHGIADQLARNKVVIIGSHVVQNPTNWPVYFEKLDGLLAWLNDRHIPVKSHAEWGKILYRSGSLLTDNIFPPMDRDLDGDGNPDGYELVNARPEASPPDAGLPDKRMLTSLKPGCMFRIQGLGGLPHGKAEIACWLSGPAGTTIDVMLHGVGPVSFVLKDGWNRYTAPITVPEKVATARVDFSWASKQEGTVSVCGIEFVEGLTGGDLR